LQSRLDEFQALETDIVAISVDPPDRSREIVESFDLGYPLLSDPEARAIEAFGVLHADGGFEGDIARPALFLADRDGRILWRELTENWRVRARPEAILQQLRP
jgi:peroxiredoxin